MFNCKWSFDLTGKGENYVSQSALEFFDLSKEEIVDRPNFWMQFIHPDDREMVNTRLDSLERIMSTEFIYRAIKGKFHSIFIHLKVNLIRNEDAEAIRLEYSLAEAGGFL